MQAKGRLVPHILYIGHTTCDLTMLARVCYIVYFGNAIASGLKPMRQLVSFVLIRTHNKVTGILCVDKDT